MNPMRMLILLAVFWAAGSLLLAAESPPTQKPAPAATSAGEAAKTDAAKTGDAKTGDSKAATQEQAKDEGADPSKDDSKRSISEQAEAALKAAAEVDGSAAKAPPPSESKDDATAPPSGNTGKGPSPQRFVPSEQVRADFDVSFPIDI